MSFLLTLLKEVPSSQEPQLNGENKPLNHELQNPNICTAANIKPFVALFLHSVENASPTAPQSAWKLIHVTATQRKCSELRKRGRERERVSRNRYKHRLECKCKVCWHISLHRRWVWRAEKTCGSSTVRACARACLMSWCLLHCQRTPAGTSFLNSGQTITDSLLNIGMRPKTLRHLGIKISCQC